MSCRSSQSGHFRMLPATHMSTHLLMSSSSAAQRSTIPHAQNEGQTSRGLVEIILSSSPGVSEPLEISTMCLRKSLALSVLPAPLSPEMTHTCPGAERQTHKHEQIPNLVLGVGAHGLERIVGNSEDVWRYGLLVDAATVELDILGAIQIGDLCRAVRHVHGEARHILLYGLMATRISPTYVYMMSRL